MSDFPSLQPAMTILVCSSNDHGICEPVLTPQTSNPAADNAKIELGDIIGIGSASKGTPLAVAVCTTSCLSSKSDSPSRYPAAASSPSLASIPL